MCNRAASSPHPFSHSHRSRATTQLHKTTSDEPRGIQWTLLSQLGDPDFDEDLAALYPKRDHLQEKSNMLNNYPEQTGPNIDTLKAKVIHVNPTNPAAITTDDKQLDLMEEFTCLEDLTAKTTAAHTAHVYSSTT